MSSRTSVWGVPCGLGGMRSRFWPIRTSSPSRAQSKVNLVELGTEADYQSITEKPALWKPVAGARLVALELVLRNMRRTFEIIEKLNLPGQTVIAAPLLAFGARIAQERLGIPLVTVCLQPSSLRSAISRRSSARYRFRVGCQGDGTNFCSGCRTQFISTPSCEGRRTACAARSG